jgi:hypothetical protein
MHFTVDSTQLKAWACLKRFQRPEAPWQPPDDPGNPNARSREPEAGRRRPSGYFSAAC